MPALPVSLAILAVLASSLLRPTGRQTILEDAKANINAFSPYQSAFIVTAHAIELITWRMTNVAEINASLWALAGVHFYVPGTHSIPSELAHGLMISSARRIFLAGVSLPLYMLLVRSSDHWVIKLFLGFLLSEAAMVEVSTWFLPLSCAGVVLRKDWPRRPIIGKQLFVSGSCPGNHVQKLNDIVAFDNNKEKRDENCQATVGDNLCDRVRRIWPPDVRPGKDIPVGRHPLEHIPNIAQITGSTGPVLVPWTCGHGRCLFYMLSRVLVRALLYFSVVLDLVSAVWLLHDNTHAFLIRISRILLAQRLLNDLLTIIFLSAVIFSVSIPTYLIFVMLLPWLSRTSIYLQSVRNRVIGFFHGTPSSVKAVGQYSVLCLSLFLAWSLTRVLMEHDPVLTDSILSYSIELALLPKVALSISRRFFVPPKSSTQQQNAGSPCDPEIAIINLPATGKADENAHCDDHKNNGKARKEMLRLCWARFRLTILLPNAAIWIFRRWEMRAGLE